MPVIRAAQFLKNNVVHCFDKDGKKISVTLETSVRGFIETKLRKKQIDDTTKIYADNRIATVAELKKQLGIGSFWSRVFKW